MIKFLLFTIRFKSAKHKANQLHELTGRKYYVIRWQNSIRVFSTLQLKALKRKGKIKIDWLKLQETALYITK